MIRGPRMMVLTLVIAAAVAFKADAQQNPSAGDPNHAQVEQLKQDMRSILQQLEPLHAQMQQLMAQLKALREQMRPLHEKLKADREQMQSLRGEH